MLTTPHVLTSLVIVKLCPSPLGVIILSLLSHFLIDFFIPHWNPHLYTEMTKNHKLSFSSLKVIFIDGLLALVALFLFSFKLLPNYGRIFLSFLAAFFAVLPDLVEIPYYFFNYKGKILSRYVEFEHKNQANANLFWGILTQILVIIACLKELL